MEHSTISQVDAFSRILDEMKDTYIRKNNDYGNSFEQSCDEWGVLAGVVRISDKFNRIRSLTHGNDMMVKNESIIDTLTDMANYCILLRMWIETGKTN